MFYIKNTESELKFEVFTTQERSLLSSLPKINIYHT